MFIVGIIVIFLVGASLHFIYELSHHKKGIAVFAAVNESTWEHIKICMTPTILWSIYEISVYGFSWNFIVAKSLCLLTIISTCKDIPAKSDEQDLVFMAHRPGRTGSIL